jgi:hypothetical protein
MSSQISYSNICLTLCNLAQRAFFHFPMQTFHPFLQNPRAKNTYFSTCMHLAYYTTCVYTGCTTTTLRTSGFVPKNEKWCRVSMSRQEIYDPWPSIYWKRSDSTLQFHLKAINGPILSYGKEEKEFNFERKVTLEKLFTSY